MTEIRHQLPLQRLSSMIVNNNNIIIIIIIVTANRRRKVQQRRSSNKVDRKLTMAPVAAAIRSMCDLGAQLTASWNQLHVGFWRGRKTGEPGEKPSSREENQQKLNPLMASGPGIEPGPHWWEASALTTTPSLLPYNEHKQTEKLTNFCRAICFLLLLPSSSC